MEFTGRELTLLIYALRDGAFKNETTSMKTEVKDLWAKVHGILQKKIT